MTSDNDNRQTLQQVIGRNLRAIRGDRTQDEFSRELRADGIDWSRATVAAVETGARDVSLEEFLALLNPRSISAHQLLATGDVNGYVQLTPKSAALPMSLAGLFAKKPGIIPPGILTPRTAPLLERASQIRGEMDDTRSQLMRICPGRITGRANTPTWTMPAEFMDDSQLDAEQKAASRLGVSPVVVAAAARTIWGESLTEHRDALVGAGGALDSPRARQAQKGHVTRGLLTELERFLTDRGVIPPALGPKTTNRRRKNDGK